MFTLALKGNRAKLFLYFIILSISYYYYYYYYYIFEIYLYINAKKLHMMINTQDMIKKIIKPIESVSSSNVCIENQIEFHNKGCVRDMHNHGR